MKVYHEEKGLERTSSKKGKVLRRKLALKGHKSKVDKRKSAPANMLSDLTSKEYENLEKMATCFLERNTDETASSDSHDEGAQPESVSRAGSIDDNGKPQAASISGVRSFSFNEGRDRGESLDSTASDDGQLADDNGEIAIDVEESLKEDRQKAIAVLKRVHPSRVSTSQSLI